MDMSSVMVLDLGGGPSGWQSLASHVQLGWWAKS